MLCVERLPTISEYEPRCSSRPPNIVLGLCNTEILRPSGFRLKSTSVPEDVTDNCTPLRHSIDLSSAKLDSANVYVKKTNGGESQKIIASNNSQSDIRNKKISPAWTTPYTITFKTDNINDSSSQRDIRHTKIKASSNIIHRVPSEATQGHNISAAIVKPFVRNTNVRPGANKVIPRSISNSSSSSSSSSSSDSSSSSSDKSNSNITSDNNNNSSNYKTDTIKHSSNLRDIRHTKIRPSTNIIHRVPNVAAAPCIRNTIVTTGATKVIPRGMSNSNSSNSSKKQHQQ